MAGARASDADCGPQGSADGGEVEPEEGQEVARTSDGQRRPSAVAPAVLAASCGGVLALALGASVRVYPLSKVPSEFQRRCWHPQRACLWNSSIDRERPPRLLALPETSGQMENPMT